MTDYQDLLRQLRLRLQGWKPVGPFWKRHGMVLWKEVLPVKRTPCNKCNGDKDWCECWERISD